jgi:phage FluMu protein gp41
MKIAEVFPNGMEIEGAVYHKYELREQLVADEVAVLESPDGPRAMTSDAFFNICLMARRLAIPQLGRNITSAEMMSLTSVDFNHLLATDRKLQAERASFRGAAEAAPDAAPAAPEVGVHGPGNIENVDGGGPGLAASEPRADQPA